MRAAIDTLADRREETAPEDATARLLDWWDQVTAWFS